MGWLERQIGQKNAAQVESNKDTERDPKVIEERMSPGLTAEYDWDLREKAGMHQPPPPPEYMGLEGDYDVNGLAKRVAAAFDKDPDINDMESLEILQDGSTIIFKGSVPNDIILSQISDIAARVDGTKAVDTSQVSVSNS